MQRWSHALTDGRTVRVVATAAADGDFFVGEPAPADLERRRRSIVDAPWTWLRQVHGSDVVHVGEPGEHAGATADGAMTTVSNAPIAVTTADCAPVVLVGAAGVSVLHAGWRGAAAGIIGRGVELLSANCGAPIASFVGPCITPSAYEFGDEDLDALIESFGPAVESRTVSGQRALDMPGMVRLVLDRSGCPAPDPTTLACTSDPAFFSHRTRGDRGRQTTVAWIEASAS